MFGPGDGSGGGGREKILRLRAQNDSLVEIVRDSPDGGWVNTPMPDIRHLVESYLKRQDDAERRRLSYDPIHPAGQHGGQPFA